MRAFTELYRRLDSSTAVRDKSAALRDYFAAAPLADAAWGFHFLSGGASRRIVSTRVLREAALLASGLPSWLFEECYHNVGDLAETIALVLDTPGAGSDESLDHWMRERLLPMGGLPPEQALDAVREAWAQLDREQRFMFNKLITGGLRVGVSRQLVLRSLAEVQGLEPGLLAQRLMGFGQMTPIADPAAFQALLAPMAPSSESAAGAGADAESAGAFALSGLLPLPFQLAQSWRDEDRGSMAASECLFEWKWDGIRAQLIREAGEVAIWSRGEELITDRFPEIAQAALAQLPPGSTLDGEILCWARDAATPMPFAQLQTRIGRKAPSRKTLRERPTVFLAFDCLRADGEDLRGWPLIERRLRLESLAGAFADPEGTLRCQPPLQVADWLAAARLREAAREQGAEGLMIKHRQSRHLIGRARSPDGANWWKWKLDPWTVDAVLIYAQTGHGRRAGLYTDYTFAVWSGPATDLGRRLVPFAKAYSGLTDAEITKVDAVIRRTTIERFGPVRSVEPSLVFEIAFEGIQASGRHRAGVAVRFPRMLRWRTDKRPEDADTLESLRALLPPAGLSASAGG
jgi:DNA ligase-1